MTLRRETIVTALALLVIAAAIPYAIVDTLETGCVYLFLNWFSTGRCIQARPCWLGRFSLAPPTHCPEH